MSPFDKHTIIINQNSSLVGSYNWIASNSTVTHKEKEIEEERLPETEDQTKRSTRR